MHCFVYTVFKSSTFYLYYLLLVFSKFSNDSDLKTRWTNSLQTIGMMQFPHNTNLHFFIQNKSTIDIPLEEISDLMKKVSLFVICHSLKNLTNTLKAPTCS